MQESKRLLENTLKDIGPHSIFPDGFQADTLEGLYFQGMKSHQHYMSGTLLHMEPLRRIRNVTQCFVVTRTPRIHSRIAANAAWANIVSTENASCTIAKMVAKNIQLGICCCVNFLTEQNPPRTQLGAVWF